MRELGVQWELGEFFLGVLFRHDRLWTSPCFLSQDDKSKRGYKVQTPWIWGNYQLPLVRSTLPEWAALPLQRETLVTNAEWQHWQDSNRVRVSWRKTSLSFGNRGKLPPTNQNQVWETHERPIPPPTWVYGYKYGRETNIIIIRIQILKWSDSLGINWKWRQQEDLHAVNLIMMKLIKTTNTHPPARALSKGRPYLQGLRLLCSLYRE